MAEFHQLRQQHNVSVRIKSIFPLAPEAVKVSYVDVEGAEEPIRHGNVVQAAFVTAAARLKLLSVLQPLGRRVLYHDTGKIHDNTQFDQK